MIETPSPNHDRRPPGRAIEMLVLHYTGMPSADEALARLCDAESKVSAHYVIGEAGELYALVPEGARAWHAGVASWRGKSDINDASIGIELVNPGHEWGYRPFPERQMAGLERLAADVLARHAIPKRNVVGHSDVAPGRKKDPGELFDWRRLARAGIGLWPSRPVVAGEMGLALEIGAAGSEVKALQEALAEFGYGIDPDGRFGTATRAVVEAFQRHFRPERVDGIAEPETSQLLFQLLHLAA
ncbi:MAG: N-acetylmuramoyl-L-alanine amidase [Alphaproteobacteria bacterium]